MERKFTKKAPRAETPKGPPWQRSAATLIAGEAAMQAADEQARRCEDAFGVDRVQYVIPAELAEKVNRQRYMYNRALSHGELSDVVTEAGRMASAWRAAYRAAEAAGAGRVVPDVWEVAGDDGRLFCLVRTDDEASVLSRIDDARCRTVWTLAEVARVLQASSMPLDIKHAWPGARVVGVRARADVLDGVADSWPKIGDDIPF